MVSNSCDMTELVVHKQVSGTVDVVIGDFV